eukprot:Selendium_serpulae@DN11686_c0_g1_i1.p1
MQTSLLLVSLLFGLAFGQETITEQFSASPASLRTYLYGECLGAFHDAQTKACKQYCAKTSFSRKTFCDVEARECRTKQCVSKTGCAEQAVSFEFGTKSQCAQVCYDAAVTAVQKERPCTEFCDLNVFQGVEIAGALFDSCLKLPKPR